jgi:CheY-like chemotaxis protein
MTRHAAAMPLNALVVEDNPVNKELVCAMLASFGATATCAWNGRIALELLHSRPFDIVLMDCDMPELDGYAATRAFREWESSQGCKRTPILAVTANALASDKAKCMEAGMDAYLAKPFKLRELRDAIEQLVSITSPAAALDAGTLDAIRSMQQPGAPNLLQKIVVTYLKSAPPLLRGIETAIATADCEEVGRAAHALKSSSGSLGALALAEICRKLEQAGRAADINALRDLRQSAELRTLTE